MRADVNLWLAVKCKYEFMSALTTVLRPGQSHESLDVVLE